MTTLVTEDPSRADESATQQRRGLLQHGWSRLVGLALAGAALLAVAVGSLLIGNLSVSLDDVFDALTGHTKSEAANAVRYVRIPRMLAGIGAGAALGVAGMIMQGVTRNPIAGPGLLGINSGAALAVVLGITVFSIATPTEYLGYAFAGATLSAIAVYTLGSIGFGGATPVKLALAGAAFTALQSALVSMLTLQSTATLADFRFWVVGSLNRANDSTLIAAAPFIAVGLVAATGLTRSLNVLALGNEIATTLGARLVIVRLVAIAAVAVLAGGATAVVGPIGFVGLVVPHIARMVTGPDYRWVFAWTLLLGPVLLIIADTVGRVVVQPQQLQVGIVTAIIGGPFFLYLVRNRRVIGV